MTVHSIDQSKWTVEHQAENWLCWAAVTKAIGEYHGVAMKAQTSLAQDMFDAGLIKSTNSPGHPKKALTELPTYKSSFRSNELWRQVRKPSNQTEIDDAVRDLGDTLVGYLSFGPILTQLTEHNDETWELTISADYSFSHAVAIIQYDDSNGFVTYTDPAKAGTMDKDVQIDDLVTGFHYADQSMFGPNALKLFVAPPQSVRARVKTLWQISEKV